MDSLLNASTVTIGKKTIVLSPQAKLAALIYFAFALALLIFMIIRLPLKMGVLSLMVLSFALYFALVGGLATYNINCLVYGGCVTYAWIVLFITSLALLLSILSVSLFKKR